MEKLIFDLLINQTRTAMFKIDFYSETITSLISNNEITIISTSTGSGKTMRVPQLAHKISNKTVYCTMPRVVMAREASRGAKKLVFDGQNDVGLMTGRGDIRGTKVVYCTEGSFVGRNIIKTMEKGQILCIDEIHEQGALTTLTLHLVKQYIAEKGIKVVLLSATVDMERYVSYFRNDFKVGTLNVPDSERPFQNKISYTDNPVMEVVNKVYETGGRGLIGVAGKGDINNMIKDIARYNRALKVFPIHGEVEQEDIDFALKYAEPCIYVATNVLQSGVTVEGLNVAYFDGIGNRMETANGQSKLMSYQLSQAEMKQWFGRIGRTCHGDIFLDKSEEQNFSSRPVMPTAEILLTPLTDIYMLFLRYGVDMETATLIDAPTNDAIKAAKKTLETLRIIKGGKFTTFGQKVQAHNSDIRGGILCTVGDTLGIANTVRKINAIDYIGHPFRNSNRLAINQDVCYSDFMIYIDLIENIILQFGYNLHQSDFEQFKSFCEEKNIFRKNLTKIMRMFEKIDNEYNDTNLSPKVVKCALYFANLDRIFHNGHNEDIGWFSKSAKSYVTTEDYTFGLPTVLGHRTKFLEGVTTISQEEKNLFDTLLN